MPTYAAIGSVGSRHAETVTVWNAETPASGSGGASASQALALPDSGVRKLRPFSVAGKFAGAPGAFEIDVQVADVDADTNYQTIAGGTINTVDAVNNTFRLDAPLNTGKFVRLLMRTQDAGGFAVTATITP